MSLLFPSPCWNSQNKSPSRRSGKLSRSLASVMMNSKNKSSFRVSLILAITSSHYVLSSGCRATTAHSEIAAGTFVLPETLTGP